MPGKRKQIMTAWKAGRKVQLQNSRKAKAKRLAKQSGLKAGSGSAGK